MTHSLMHSLSHYLYILLTLDRPFPCQIWYLSEFHESDMLLIRGRCGTKSGIVLEHDLSERVSDRYGNFIWN